MEEQRATARVRAFRPGTIQLGESSISCIVRNVSDEGAALDVVSPHGIPDRFVLVLTLDGVRRCCRVICGSVSSLTRCRGRSTKDLTRRAYQAHRARNRRTAQDSQFRLAMNTSLGKNALELISARFLGDPVFGCDGFKSDTGRDLGGELRFRGRQSECSL